MSTNVSCYQTTLCMTMSIYKQDSAVLWRKMRTAQFNCGATLSKTQFHFTAHSSPDINPIDSKTYGVIQYQLQVNNIEEIKQRLPETRQSSNIAFD